MFKNKTPLLSAYLSSDNGEGWMILWCSGIVQDKQFIAVFRCLLGHFPLTYRKRHKIKIPFIKQKVNNLAQFVYSVLGHYFNSMHIHAQSIKINK